MVKALVVTERNTCKSKPQQLIADIKKPDSKPDKMSYKEHPVNR